MKEIEDFLKRKLFGHQEPGSQSQNDQLWDKIDKGFSMDGPKKAPPSTVDQPRRRMLLWIAAFGSLCLVAVCLQSLKNSKAPSKADEVGLQAIGQDSPSSTIEEDAVRTQELGHGAWVKVDSLEAVKEDRAYAKPILEDRNETDTKMQFLGQERSKQSNRLTETADESDPKPDFNNLDWDSADIQYLLRGWACPDLI